MTSFEVIPLIIIALSSSFSHCIGMCGGFVLSYSSTKIDKSWSAKYKIFMHLLYGLGRTSSYVMLGIVFGFLGFILSVSLFYKGIINISLGIFMMIIGISLIDKMKILKYIKIDILNLALFKKLHFHTFKSKSKSSFFIFGILNGLIPCGLVYFFLASSLSASSITESALYMLIFGICTIPSLLMVGILHNIINNNYIKIINYISSFLIMSYGLFTIFKGILLVNNIMPMH